MERLRTPTIEFFRKAGNMVQCSIDGYYHGRSNTKEGALILAAKAWYSAMVESKK